MAISYDSPETLKKFAESCGIRFPLISDAGSAIIKRFGILNEEQEPGTRSYGIPHPGTFIVDRKGVVTARFFEDAYQNAIPLQPSLPHKAPIPAAPPSLRRRKHLA